MDFSDDDDFVPEIQENEIEMIEVQREIERQRGIRCRAAEAAEEREVNFEILELHDIFYALYHVA